MKKKKKRTSTAVVPSNNLVTGNTIGPMNKNGSLIVHFLFICEMIYSFFNAIIKDKKKVYSIF